MKQSIAFWVWQSVAALAKCDIFRKIGMYNIFYEQAGSANFF